MFCPNEMTKLIGQNFVKSIGHLSYLYFLGVGIGHRLNMKKPKKKFSKIYDEYIEKIYRFIYLKVGSREAAQDITSQVFANSWNVYRDEEKRKGIKNINAYIYQIARSEVANYYRDKNKMEIVSAESFEMSESEPNPEESQINQSDIINLRDKLSKLKDEEQNLIIWRFVEGLSYKKIGAILDKKEGTVRVMVHRAMNNLKGRLKDTN